jgi:hypothetical protein
MAAELSSAPRARWRGRHRAVPVLSARTVAARLSAAGTLWRSLPPRRRRWWTVGIVWSLTALILGGLSAANAADSAWWIPTPAPASDASIDAAVTEVGHWVARQRGHDFRHPVPVERVPDGTEMRRRAHGAEGQRVLTDHADGVLHALDVLRPEVSLATAAEYAADLASAGFYDRKTGTLVVPDATAVTPAFRLRVAGELTRALDDQWFPARTDRQPDGGDLSNLAATALYDGDAARIRVLYAATLSRPERASLDEPTGSNGPRRYSPVIRRWVDDSRTYGGRLVTRILARSGRSGLDKAFAQQPRDSRQAMFPDVYLSDKRVGGPPSGTPSTGSTSPPPGGSTKPGTAVPVPAPSDPPGQANGVLGAHVLSIVLDRDAEDTSPALRGWSADRYVLWQEHGRVCVRVTITGVDARSTAEVRDALTKVTRGRAETVVRSDNKISFNVTSCGPPAVRPTG